MAINFPTSLDVFTDPSASDQLNLPSHSGQHTDLNNAVEALEAKVGADGSAVTTSHDYKIAQLEAGATGGKIIAVKHALFTGTQTNSTAAGANFAVTDLSITHTLADSANKLIISAYFGAAANSTDEAQVGIAVANDGTLVGVGDAAGNRSRVAAGGYVQATGTGDNYVVTMPSITFVYEPGDTSSHTYTVRAVNIQSNTNTIYINRSEIDADFTYSTRASSGFVIQEVAA